jgi:hypothetical protein
MNLEQDFQQAYRQHYGYPLKQMQRLQDGRYLVNGLLFSQSQLEVMLATLQKEQVKQRKPLVQRLIAFFGGRQAS